MPVDESADLHCRAVTQELGEPAPGSAGSMQHVVLVELPLPWPKNIEDHPLLQRDLLGTDVNDAVDGATVDGIKIFGIAGTSTTPDGHLIISYMPTGDGSTSFVRSERVVPSSQVLSSVAESVSWEHTVPDTTDLLVCTHGSRDRCCGQYGTLLHVEMLAAAPEDTRIWRGSHLGGHRFAPTVTTFPDGLNWAYVGGEMLQSILDRSADPAAVAPLLRGAVSLPSRAVQAADAAVFASAGWGWLDGARSFTSDGPTVTATSAEGTYTIAIDELDPVPVPPCGEPIDKATKTSRPVRARLVSGL